MARTMFTRKQSIRFSIWCSGSERIQRGDGSPDILSGDGGPRLRPQCDQAAGDGRGRMAESVSYTPIDQD